MTRHNFLIPFEVLLLDMNSTFVFGEDRFGPEQDYGATYRRLGGASLSDHQVCEYASTCVDYMHRLAQDPARYNDFPSVNKALASVTTTNAIEPLERERLADLIAIHECGEIPDPHAAALHKLSEHHRLGLVTYIWSEKTRWLQMFKGAGLDGCFESITWSADGRAIKPAPALFERAISTFDVPRQRMVYIGDNPMRDIEAAAAVGLATIWIDDGTRKSPAVQPGLVVNSLTDLVSGDENWR